MHVQGCEALLEKRSKTGDRMKVAVLDPSAFTPPYDHHLCKGLASHTETVRLVASKKPFFDNQLQRPYTLDTHFYKYTDSLFPDDSPKSFRLAFKGCEHMWDMLRLISMLREFNPDIIHFQWLPLPLVDQWFLSRLRRISPILFTVHDSNPFHDASSSRLQLLGANDVLDKFDRLIAHTEFTKQELQDSDIPERKISIVPHGVLPYSTPDSTSDQTDSQRVLFFGTLKPYKGLRILFRAFAQLPAEIQEQTELYIAGQPQMPMAPLKNLAAELTIESNIRWDLRYIPDEQVPVLFQSADIVAFPYREIDQSGALMTALQFGKPIVATAVGGFPEVLDDGVHGRLVAPDDPDAFADGLAQLLRNPESAAAMGAAVQTLAETTYSWDEIASKTVSIYRELL